MMNNLYYWVGLQVTEDSKHFVMVSSPQTPETTNSPKSPTVFKLGYNKSG